MDNQVPDEEQSVAEKITAGKEKIFVHTQRDWKEYLGESLLIIFSVLLALVLTEYFNNQHEKETTKGILKNIVAELNHNKKSLQEMKAYNLQVLTKIDSALVSRQQQEALVNNDEFQLRLIAPQGVLYRYLENVAWTVAKNNNLMSKTDLETIALLTKVYDDQERVMKVEDEMAKLLFNRASRDPKQVHATLIMIRDIYHGWVVDRTDSLLLQMDNAIKKISKN